MAHGGADAISAGVGAANDDDVFAVGGDVIAIFVTVEQGLRVRVEKLHGKMNSLEVAAFDGQVARLGGAGAEDNGVKLFEEFVGGKVHAHFGVVDELDALFFEEV